MSLVESKFRRKRQEGSRCLPVGPIQSFCRMLAGMFRVLRERGKSEFVRSARGGHLSLQTD